MEGAFLDQEYVLHGNLRPMLRKSRLLQIKDHFSQMYRMLDLPEKKERRFFEYLWKSYITVKSDQADSFGDQYRKVPLEDFTAHCEDYFASLDTETMTMRQLRICEFDFDTRFLHSFPELKESAKKNFLVVKISSPRKTTPGDRIKFENMLHQSSWNRDNLIFLQENLDHYYSPSITSELLLKILDALEIHDSRLPVRHPDRLLKFDVFRQYDETLSILEAFGLDKESIECFISLLKLISPHTKGSFRHNETARYTEEESNEPSVNHYLRVVDLSFINFDNLRLNFFKNSTMQHVLNLLENDTHGWRNFAIIALLHDIIEDGLIDSGTLHNYLLMSGIDEKSADYIMESLQVLNFKKKLPEDELQPGEDLSYEKAMMRLYRPNREMLRCIKSLGDGQQDNCSLNQKAYNNGNIGEKHRTKMQIKGALNSEFIEAWKALPKEITERMQVNDYKRKLHPFFETFYAYVEERSTKINQVTQDTADSIFNKLHKKFTVENFA